MLQNEPSPQEHIQSAVDGLDRILDLLLPEPPGGDALPGVLRLGMPREISHDEPRNLLFLAHAAPEHHVLRTWCNVGATSEEYAGRRCRRDFRPRGSPAWLHAPGRDRPGRNLRRRENPRAGMRLPTGAITTPWWVGGDPAAGLSLSLLPLVLRIDVDRGIRLPILQLGCQRVDVLPCVPFRLLLRPEIFLRVQPRPRRGHGAPAPLELLGAAQLIEVCHLLDAMLPCGVDASWRAFLQKFLDILFRLEDLRLLLGNERRQGREVDDRLSVIPLRRFQGFFNTFSLTDGSFQCLLLVRTIGIQLRQLLAVGL